MRDANCAECKYRGMVLVTVKPTRCDEYRWLVVKCFMGTQTMAGIREAGPYYHACHSEGGIYLRINHFTTVIIHNPDTSFPPRRQTQYDRQWMFVQLHYQGSSTLPLPVIPTKLSYWQAGRNLPSLRSLYYGYHSQF